MTSASDHVTTITRSINEMRFSLEGFVIPRSVVLPGHLGLHHHGDEPQVDQYCTGQISIVTLYNESICIFKLAYYACGL